MSFDVARRQSVSLMLRRSAVRHAGRTALIFGAARLSYAELDLAVDRLAAGLLAAGVGRGDRVAILARNSHAFVAIRFAIARIAAVLVPVNFMLKADEVRYILEHSDARMLFVDATTLDVGLAALTPAVTRTFAMPDEAGVVPVRAGVESWDALSSDRVAAPDPTIIDAAGVEDLLQIIYTSGTESRPKGAMLTHGAVLWQYQSVVIDCEWTCDAVMVHALPLFHCAQLDAMIGPALQVGAINVIVSSPAPEIVIPRIAEFRATSFFAPPTVWISLLRSPLFDAYDLGSLVKGYYGASIMPVEVLREIQQRLPRLRLWNLYGQTEIAPVATILTPEEHADHVGSAGRPALHVETRVVDEAMADVAPGETGEIVHRSPQLMTGYWKDEARTAEAFAGGWFHSGDLATIDAQGYITVVDRKKDMIKTGGENVASREVEEVLYGHPSVSEVAVIGVPHAHWIEAVIAVVVRRTDATCGEQTLIAHCAASLGGFKVPKRVLFRDTLPRNASGKILKRDLRIWAGEQV